MRLISSRLQEYSVETAIAIIADGSAVLKIDSQHLRDLSFRVGSIYQFIGELHIQPDNEVRGCYYWVEGLHTSLHSSSIIVMIICTLLVSGNLAGTSR